MPDLDYAYTPIYGVEPYLDNNGLGGATITGDNMLVTLWATKFDEPTENFKQLLKPNSVNTSVPTQKRTAALQAMQSRTSCRFLFRPSPDPLSDAVWPVVMVLKPPQEYRQQMAGAVKYNGGDPTNLANFTIKKSLQGCYSWTQQVVMTGGGGSNLVSITGWFMAFSVYLPGVADPPDIPITFLKTSGADGQIPVFFDNTTPEGVKEMIYTVDNMGDYYVAMFMQHGGGALSPAYAGAIWPHSMSRN